MHEPLSLLSLRHHSPSAGHTIHTNAFWGRPHDAYGSRPRGDFLREAQRHLHLLCSHSRVSERFITLTPLILFSG